MRIKWPTRIARYYLAGNTRRQLVEDTQKQKEKVKEMATTTQECSGSGTEDSDATVAADIQDSLSQELMEEEFQTQCSVSSSPSILHPKGVLPISSDKDGEIIPCTSDEDRDTISQEFPFLEARKDDSVTTITTADETPSLRHIEDNQASLMFDINKALDNDCRDVSLSSNFVKKAQTKVSDLEKKLKLISEANRAERESLSEVHASLSQGEQGLSGESQQLLMSRLVSLSARQKSLLQCFAKQKEIVGRLEELIKQEEVYTRKTREDAKTTNTRIPDLSKHLLQQHHHHPAPPPAPSSTTVPTTTTTTAVAPPPPAAVCVSEPQKQQQQPPVRPAVFTVAGAHLSESQPNPLAFQAHLKPRQNTLAAAASHCGGESLPNSNRSSASISVTDLTQPVPLSTLIQHGVISPGERNLTCTILGCDFIGSLLDSGSIEEVHTYRSPESGGPPSHHQHPQHWVKACWAHLGHYHRKITRKQAYSTVFYGEKTLSSHCQHYSLKQVSSYLNKKKKTGNIHKTDTPTTAKTATHIPQQQKTANCIQSSNPSGTPVTSATSPLLPMLCQENAETQQQKTATAVDSTTFNLDRLLTCGKVWVIPSGHSCSHFPGDIWGSSVDISEELKLILEKDLKW